MVTWQVRKTPPGSFVAMGTNGLNDVEVCALTPPWTPTGPHQGPARDRTRTHWSPTSQGGPW